MTTYYSFTPSNDRPPYFMPTFDGNSYTIKILWNVSAKRYYIYCTSTINNNLIFMVPLIESSPSIVIKSLEWDQYNDRIVLETQVPHGFIVGSVVDLVISGCAPDDYNGTGLCTILSPTQIFYPLSAKPDDPDMYGVVSKIISLTKGYFLSTLVYRNGVFEVNP